MYEQIFIQAGLSKEQAKIYELLIQNMGVGASQISLKTGIERTFAYKVLGQLIDLSLAEKEDKKGEITRFFAKSPSRLKEIVDEKAKLATQTQDLVNNQLGQAISEYNLNVQKPNIVFIEGIDGVKKINKEIIAEAVNGVKLMRSFIDKQSKESHSLIEEQISKRVALGIKTMVVGPLPAGKETDIAILKTRDKERLVTRGVIENFEIPAQVLIYGNKVAITDYKNGIVTTIIDNASVRETFEKIFDFMFEKADKI